MPENASTEDLKKIRELLPILVCPETHRPLQLAQRGEEWVLVVESVPRYYPILDGIPQLLIDLAVTIDEEQHQVLLSNKV